MRRALSCSPLAATCDTHRTRHSPLETSFRSLATDQGYNVTNYAVNYANANNVTVAEGMAAFNKCIPETSSASWWGTSYLVFTLAMQALNLPLIFITFNRLIALAYGMKKKVGEEYYTLWWSNSVAHNYIFIALAVFGFPFTLLDVDGFMGWFDSFGIDMLLEIRTASMIYVLLRSIFSWVATLSSKGAKPKLTSGQTAAKYTLITMAWMAPVSFVLLCFFGESVAGGGGEKEANPKINLNHILTLIPLQHCSFFGSVKTSTSRPVARASSTRFGAQSSSPLLESLPFLGRPGLSSSGCRSSMPWEVSQSLTMPIRRTRTLPQLGASSTLCSRFRSS